MARIGSSEFTRYQILEQIEPFGERANWIRHGMLCALIANVNRAEGQPAAEIEDFIPATFKSKPVEEEVDEEERKKQAERFKKIMFALMEKQNAWVAQQSQGNA